MPCVPLALALHARLFAVPMHQPCMPVCSSQRPMRQPACPPQVRRCFVLLPEALGRDQPGCLALVLQHFEGEGAAVWSFDALMQARCKQGGWVVDGRPWLLCFRVGALQAAA